jgi:hypothetical protein
VVLRLSRAEFDQFLASHPQRRQGLMDTIGQKMEHHLQVQSICSNFCCICSKIYFQFVIPTFVICIADCAIPPWSRFRQVGVFGLYVSLCLTSQERRAVQGGRPGLVDVYCIEWRC